MRAVASTIVLLTLCGFAYAEESKPLATQAGEATAPIAEAIGSGFSRIVTEFMAGTDGMVGDAARKNLKMQDKRDREANRGVRKTMKECIKPENVIDDDVKECIEGTRKKNGKITNLKLPRKDFEHSKTECSSNIQISLYTVQILS